MPHILLTGAGFSRNWGGFLANEAFEYLLGAAASDPDLRRFLWGVKKRGGGFEDALAQLQGAFSSQWSAQTEQDFRNLTSAIYTMFGEMSLAFAARQFEPQTNVPMMVGTFLSQFDAIFTLNQDTLLELKFFGHVVGGKYTDCYLPGIKYTGTTWSLSTMAKTINLRTPDPAGFHLVSGRIPYIKLHGSCDWVYDERNLLLILGGNKIASIAERPILRWFHEVFADYLCRPDTRLMIIGYSFNDDHINTAIKKAVAANGLSLFIIDPSGVDVLDKRDPLAPIPQPIGELFETLSPSVIGASRRPLLSTFNDDTVEHEKLMRFFR
jgi:SIR2-like domain